MKSRNKITKPLGSCGLRVWRPQKHNKHRLYARENNFEYNYRLIDSSFWGHKYRVPRYFIVGGRLILINERLFCGSLETSTRRPQRRAS